MPQSLGQLRKGQSGQIVSVQTDEAGIAQRLMEIGLLIGSHVQVLHEAPMSGDPIVVRVRGALIALRRNEASHILVSPIG